MPWNQPELCVDPWTGLYTKKGLESVKVSRQSHTRLFIIHNTNINLAFSLPRYSLALSVSHFNLLLYEVL